MVLAKPHGSRHNSERGLGSAAVASICYAASPGLVDRPHQISRSFVLCDIEFKSVLARFTEHVALDSTRLADKLLSLGAHFVEN